MSECNLCGGASSLLCPPCDNRPFCDACDDLYHRHPSRAAHKRNKIQKPEQGTLDYKGNASHIKCKSLFLISSAVLTETCSICGISAVHTHCSTCIQRLCMNCDRLFHSHPDRKGHSRTNITPVKTCRWGFELQAVKVRST